MLRDNAQQRVGDFRSARLTARGWEKVANAFRTKAALMAVGVTGSSLATSSTSHLITACIFRKLESVLVLFVGLGR